MNQLEQLKELATLVEGDSACDTCAWAVAEIARLQGYVDKLPRDHSGKPITHNTITFCVEEARQKAPFPHMWCIRDQAGRTFEEHVMLGKEYHFPTREAAEAAREKT